MTKVRSRDPLGVGGKWKYQNVGISMGFSKKNYLDKKIQFLPTFWWFFGFFYISRKTKILKIQKKIVIFRKFDQKSSFCVPVGLYHPVSENIGHAGHFGVFTTHTTLFFALFGSIEVAAQVCPKWWNPDGIFADFGECSKNSGEKCNGLKNILFLPFCSKFNVVYEKNQNLCKFTKYWWKYHILKIDSWFFHDIFDFYSHPDDMVWADVALYRPKIESGN